MSTLLSLVAYTLLTGLSLWLLFLLFLAACSWLQTRQKPAQQLSPTLRLAILIPAHNEEHAIERTIVSIQNASYPKELKQIFVVADNCSDQTASKAKKAGAIVWERNAPDSPGKTPAIEFGIDNILNQGWYDAVLFFDADGEISPNYLEEAALSLQQDNVIFQGCSLVEAPERTWFTRLSCILLALKNHWQLPALTLFKLGVPLNGACIGMRTGVIMYLQFDNDSITESLDWSITFMENDIAIGYSPAATFTSKIPETPEAATPKYERWAKGETHARKRLIDLLKKSLYNKKPKTFLSCLSMASPPFPFYVTLTLALAGMSVFIGLLSGQWTPLHWSLIIFGGCICYCMLGVSHIGISAENLRCLTKMPTYTFWRIAIYRKVHNFFPLNRKR